MKAPSSRHLSHDFPAYKGLSLRELLVIVVTTTGFSCCLFSIVGFFTSWMVAIALLPKPIARFKAGKPHGYLMKTLTLTLVRFGLKQSPYLHYKGIWQRTKRLPVIESSTMSSPRRRGSIPDAIPEPQSKWIPACAGTTVEQGQATEIIGSSHV